MAKYEIYETKKGNKRVNIGDSSYLLAPYERGSSDPRQCAAVRNGEYGTLVQAYANACDEVGIKLTYAWDGIINGMGDHARVMPPWKGKPYNYGRG